MVYTVDGLGGSQVRSRLAAAVLALALAGCWPVPGQGPDRNADNPFEQTITAANVSALKVVWNANTGGQFVSSPVVSDAGVHVTAVITSSGGYVVGMFTYHTNTGGPMWTTAVSQCCAPGIPAFSPPFVLSDRVAAGWEFVKLGPGYIDVRGAPAFDISTGASRGTVGPGPIDSVRDSTVVSSWNPVVGPFQQSHNFSVTNLTDPTKTWGGNGPGTFTLGSKHVFEAGSGSSSTVAGQGSDVIGVRAYPITAPPINCGSMSNLACPQWVKPFDRVSTPVLSPDNSTVYVVGTTGSLSSVYALDAAAGTVLWRGSLGTTSGASPALANGKLFVPTDQGNVLVFDANGCASGTCTPLWSDATGVTGPLYQPVVGGDVLYTAAQESGSLPLPPAALRAFPLAGCGQPACTPIFSASITSGISDQPAVSNGRLFVPTEDGHLVAYGVN